MYGRKYFDDERTTFVIGPDGVITHVFRKVKSAERDTRVPAALSSLARWLARTSARALGCWYERC